MPLDSVSLVCDDWIVAISEDSVMEIVLMGSIVMTFGMMIVFTFS